MGSRHPGPSRNHPGSWGCWGHLVGLEGDLSGEQVLEQVSTLIAGGGAGSAPTVAPEPALAGRTLSSDAFGSHHDMS